MRCVTKSLRCLIAVSVLSISYFSCKKNEDKPSSINQLESVFLSVPESAPTALKRVGAEIRRENEKYHFLNSFAKKRGLPKWDKSRLLTNPQTKGGRFSGTGDDTVVIVPLVKMDSSTVTSFLACTVNQDSVKIRLFRADQYDRYPISNSTDSLTSTMIASEFMFLDYQVFGYDMFRISDNRIFNYPNVGTRRDGSRLLFLKNSASKAARQSFRTGNLITVEVCWQELMPPAGYQTGGNAPGETPNYGYYQNRCESYSMWVETVNMPPLGGSSGSGSTSTVDPGTMDWTDSPYFWNNDPCDIYTYQSPDAECQDGVIGWQPLQPFLDAWVDANDFQNPCIVAAMNKIGDIGLNYMGKMFKWQQDGLPQQWKFILQEDRTLTYPDGRPQPSQSFPITPYKEYHIVLNPILWEQSTAPNATQELAGLAIIHEFTHGFVWINRDYYNLDYHNATFSSHEQMFLNCVDGMAAMLQNSFNLSRTDAVSLALQGMDDVLQKTFTGNTLTSYNAEKNQFAIDNYGVSIPDAQAIFDQYSNGTKGTHCF